MNKVHFIPIHTVHIFIHAYIPLTTGHELQDGLVVVGQANVLLSIHRAIRLRVISPLLSGPRVLGKALSHHSRKQTLN